MDRVKRMEVLNILDECRARKLTYSTAFNKIEEIFIADEQSEVSVEAKVKPACEQCKKFEECEIRKLVWFDMCYPKPLCEFYCSEFESKSV